RIGRSVEPHTWERWAGPGRLAGLAKERTSGSRVNSGRLGSFTLTVRPMRVRLGQTVVAGSHQPALSAHSPGADHSTTFSSSRARGRLPVPVRARESAVAIQGRSSG